MTELLSPLNRAFSSSSSLPCEAAAAADLISMGQLQRPSVLHGATHSNPMSRGCDSYADTFPHTPMHGTHVVVLLDSSRSVPPVQNCHVAIRGRSWCKGTPYKWTMLTLRGCARYRGDVWRPEDRVRRYKYEGPVLARWRGSGLAPHRITSRAPPLPSPCRWNPWHLTRTAPATSSQRGRRAPRSGPTERNPLTAGPHPRGARISGTLCSVGKYAASDRETGKSRVLRVALAFGTIHLTETNGTNV